MFWNAFLINENQHQHFYIYITVYYIYHQDIFFLDIFKNTPDKHKYFYYYIIKFYYFDVEYSQKSFLYAFLLSTYSWRVVIQKGVTHNFSKIVFSAKKIPEVNANTIAQTIFFPIGDIFIFDLEINNLYLEVSKWERFCCRRVKFQKYGLRPFECSLFSYSHGIIDILNARII